MAETRIFISHSTNNDYGGWVQTGVKKALEAKGFKVLLDDDGLEPGDEWRAKLHDWLATCHGGVILFSRAALKSKWVLKESTILTWRMAINPKLRVVPALLGDVERKETGLEGFRPNAIDELQFARISSKQETRKNAKALVAKIVKAFKNFKSTEIEAELETWLRKVKSCLGMVEEGDLDAAAVELNIHSGTWNDVDKDARLQWLAYSLLCTPLEEALDCFSELANTMPDGQRERFAALILPIWVSQEAARNILPATRKSEDQRYIAINTEWQRLAIHYLYRATCCQRDLIIIKATNIAGEGGLDELIPKYLKAAKRDFGIPTDRPADYVRAQCENSKQPFFMLVGAAGCKQKVLARLRQDYPGITFVLVPGLTVPEPDKLGLKELELIQPVFTSGSQRDADNNVSAARKNLRLSQEDG